jgi:hypothetical protein
MFQLMILFLSLPALATGASSWSPSVRYSGHSLIAIPASQHHPQVQRMEILEEEECHATVTGAARIEISERCAFLRGVYRYFFIPENGVQRHQILMEFTLTRKSGSSYALLVDSPLEFEEPKP